MWECEVIISSFFLPAVEEEIKWTITLYVNEYHIDHK